MKRKAVRLLLAVALVASVLCAAFFSGGVFLEDPLLLLLDKDRALTFEGALAIAEGLDRIGDQLEMPAGPTEQGLLDALAFEIIPFFYYDGIIEGQPQMPKLLWLYYEEDGNFHVAGRYSAWYNVATLNVRMVNPYSSWYRRPSSYATLAHELAHSQGIVLIVTDEKTGRPKLHKDTETATQLATLEVLAALARDKAPWAFPVFVRQLQGYVDDFAFSCALQEDRMDEYRAYVRRIASSSFGEARFERAMAHWEDDMDTLKGILKDYGERPYRLLVDALSRGSHLTKQLDPVPNRWHRIEMDDTAWIVDNLYRMARDYPELLAKSKERMEE